MINIVEGRIIFNISSISATRPIGYKAYSSSKGTVISLSRAMGLDHGNVEIISNCILPGPVHNPMVYSKEMSDDFKNIRKKATLLNIERYG